MHYNQSCAAKGDYRSAARHLPHRSMERAAVNIYRGENSIEMLVFAPGRIKEHFSLDVKDHELTITYRPPEGFPRPDWILREYSRGGFERSFRLKDHIDTAAITATYEHGVLKVTLPVIPGHEDSSRQIPVS